MVVPRLAWRWVAVSLAIFGAVQLAPLVLLGVAGWAAVGVSVAVWFIGGVVVGFLSPGRTIVEPGAAAIVAAIPTAIYLYCVSPAAAGPGPAACAAASLLGALLGLGGAWLGETLQDLTSEQ